MLDAIRLAAAALLLGSLPACLVAAEDSRDDGDESAATAEDALTPGVNGGACTHSPFNCKLRVDGGNRITNAQGEEWGVEPAPVVDGNGVFMANDTKTFLKFNYGQTRHMNGVTYAYAMATSAGSSGWFPMSAIKSEQKFRDRVGEVNAKDTGGERMGCYEIRNAVDESLVEKKVVYDAEGSHERAGDYLPLIRDNGKRYSNLAFNVPGFGLGGPAIDIYPAGTKFQRIDVPTSTGAPSIDIPLYVDNGKGHYTKKSGALKFVYGFIVSKPGAKRFGWMAYPALKVSSSCPQK